LILGTPNGVFRFDGHRFAEMDSDPPKEIIVESLAEGPDGDLWVGTPFAIFQFPHAEIDQRRQTPAVYHLGQGVVNCLRFSRAGVLWAGTAQGLFYFAKDHFQQVVAGRNVRRIEEARNGHLLLITALGFVE
jgi:ligand-binding sensor domain-containing protein